jgi:hypothetical protein
MDAGWGADITADPAPIQPRQEPDAARQTRRLKIDVPAGAGAHPRRPRQRAILRFQPAQRCASERAIDIEHVDHDARGQPDIVQPPGPEATDHGDIGGGVTEAGAPRQRLLAAPAQGEHRPAAHRQRRGTFPAGGRERRDSHDSHHPRPGLARPGRHGSGRFPIGLDAVTGPGRSALRHPADRISVAVRFCDMDKSLPEDRPCPIPHPLPTLRVNPISSVHHLCPGIGHGFK